MLRLIFSCLAACLALPCEGIELSLDFAKANLNEPPPGFRSTVSGKGKPGDWRILLDEAPPLTGSSPAGAATNKRPVLAQLARDPADEHFPLLIYEPETFWDFALSARFKTVGGAVEQMAGIAFRIQDEQNYYVLRASSLGHTLKFYKVVDGQRGTLIGPQVELPNGVWQEITVECRGNTIRCSLNGQEAMPPLNDNSFSSGKIGFWTKSDSVSHFADLRITYAPRKILAQTVVEEAMTRYPRLIGLEVYASKGNPPAIVLIANSDSKNVGRTGRQAERDVIERNVTYYGKEKSSVSVTLPLHDRNGEAIAAVRVVMKSFPGQTEQNAIARAIPIVQTMETRVRSLKDLTE